MLHVIAFCLATSTSIRGSALAPTIPICAFSQGVGEAVPFPDYGVTLKLPQLDSLDPENPKERNCKAEWLGQWGPSKVRLRFHVLPNSEYEFVEPEDVVETWQHALRDPEKQGNEDKPFEFSFESVHCVPGPVGCTPILARIQASMQKKDDRSSKGLLLLAGGLLMENGWSLRIDAWPAPDAERTASLVAYVEKCITYDGKLRDPKWTDEEALAFWKQLAPESTFKKFEKPTRTEHFIVLTNSTSPGVFVKKLETKYATIRKVLPFEELKGRRLLPVLLFRTDGDFQACYRRVFKMEVKEDVDEGSFVLGDFMATSCDNDDEYGDLVDLMRLVLINRQHGWGGDRWFRSGLREYVASKPKDRMDGVRAVKSGKYTPLEKLLDDGSWGKQDRKLEKRGVSDEVDYWEQSAMWIEFLRDGPWPKDKFPRFVQTVGGLPRGDCAGTRAAIESIYGMDLIAIEKKWVEYFTKH